MISGILKIIGIVFLCIIAFVLAVLLAVLFLPFRYKITANGNGKEISAKAHIKWLFGFIRAFAVYDEGDLSFNVKILFFSIFKGDLKDNKDAEGPDKKIKKQKKEKIPEKPHKHKKSSAAYEQKNASPSSDMNMPKRARENLQKETLYTEKEKEETFPLKTKILSFIDKARNLWEKLKTIKYIWDAPATKRALAFVKLRLFELLNHIKPRKIKGRIIFSLDSPDTLAFVYAAASFLICGRFNDLILEPDFDGKGIKIENLNISGRIFVCTMLLLALKILKNKDLKRVIKYIRRNL